MPDPVEARKSFLGGLLHRAKRPLGNIADVPDQQLDDALARLSCAFGEHEVVSDRVRRRQSSGSLKIVSIPATDEE